MKLTAANLSAIKSACDNFGYSVRRYSGRGMYGSHCLGVECDRFTSPATVAFRLAVELMDSDERELADEIAGMEWSQDSLGLGAIVYLPRLTWEADLEDGDDEEDEPESAPAIASDGSRAY